MALSNIKNNGYNIKNEPATYMDTHSHSVADTKRNEPKIINKKKFVRLVYERKCCARATEVKEVEG